MRWTFHLYSHNIPMIFTLFYNGAIWAFTHQPHLYICGYYSICDYIIFQRVRCEGGGSLSSTNTYISMCRWQTNTNSLLITHQSLRNHYYFIYTIYTKHPQQIPYIFEDILVLSLLCYKVFIWALCINTITLVQQAAYKWINKSTGNESQLVHLVIMSLCLLPHFNANYIYVVFVIKWLMFGNSTVGFVFIIMRTKIYGIEL